MDFQLMSSSPCKSVFLSMMIKCVYEDTFCTGNNCKGTMSNLVVIWHNLSPQLYHNSARYTHEALPMRSKGKGKVSRLRFNPFKKSRH